MSFLYQEPIAPSRISALPVSLRLASSTAPEATLIRVLAGSSNIVYIPSGEVVKQRKRILDARGVTNRTVSIKGIKQAIAPLALKSYDGYLTQFARYNSNLFKDLTSEVSYYFLYTSRGSHVSAFLHIYRFLEYISYSFPLIHASDSKSFQGTYTRLKDFFAGGGGELAFLKKFVAQLFSGDPVLSTSVDIPIPSSDPGVQALIASCIQSDALKAFVAYDQSKFEASIKYADLVDFIVTLRNRYFHFAVGGQTNIRARDLGDPDVFFGMVNPPCINWLGMIYFEILKTVASKY